MKITMKALFLFLVILVVSTEFACTESSNPCVPKRTSGPLVPLVVGNQWVYHVITFDEQGNITSNSTYDTNRVISDTLIQGERWFFYYGLFEYCVNRSDGLWVRGYLTPDSLTDYLAYKFPGEKGDTNILSSNVIVSTDTVISTEYGCFHTYEYVVDDAGIQAHNFFAPGIGLIKSEGWYKFTPPYKIRESSLRSAELH